MRGGEGVGRRTVKMLNSWRSGDDYEGARLEGKLED